MKDKCIFLLFLFMLGMCSGISDCHAQDDDASGETNEWEALRKQVMRDPFEGADEFSINFANYTIEEWNYPLPGGKVISPFGGRRKHHAGTDIKTVRNDTLRAAFPGIVTLSAPHYGYGHCVIVRHANGLETLYSHNSKNLVKVGDWVHAGEAVALEGSTGRATTHHLHFETRVKGRAFDSAKIFDHASHSLRKGVATFTMQRDGKLQIGWKDAVPSEPVVVADTVPVVVQVQPDLTLRTSGLVQKMTGGK